MSSSKGDKSGKELGSVFSLTAVFLMLYFGISSRVLQSLVTKNSSVFYVRIGRSLSRI